MNKLMFGLKLGVLASTVFALSLTPVFAGGCLEPGGHWPLGPVYVVAPVGALAVYSEGVTIKIADVSDPSNPVVLGAAEIAGVPRGIAVSDTIAFVAAGDEGLFIVDFSDPTAPAVIGHWSAFQEQVSDVAANGDHVFISHNRLIVLDVSDPTTPVEVARETTWSPLSIELVGNHVYGIGTGNLIVYDIADPTAPSVVFHEREGGYTFIAANENRLFTTYNGDLSVYTLDDPATPVLATEYDDPEASFQSMTVSGTHAYLTTYNDEFAIVDTTNAASPATVSIQPSPGNPRNVAVAGSTVFLTAEEGGLRLLDVTDPTGPTELGFVPAAGSSIDLAVAGDHAFVAQRGSGLRVFDVSNPDEPLPIGFLALGGALDVTLDGTRALVTAAEDGIFVIDIVDPSDPILLGGIDTPDRASKSEIVGDLAYVADGDSGLLVYDISDPTAITEVGAMSSVESAVDVAIAGDVAFIADCGWGLATVDISNPSMPVKLWGGGSWDNYCAQGVVLKDNLAILVEGWHIQSSGEIFIYDVTNPSTPILITDFEQTPSNWIGWDLEIDGNVLYVAYEQATVVFDLSNPLAPALIGRQYTPGYSTGVDLEGDRVFIGAYTGGIASAVCTKCSNAVFADGWEDFEWFYTAWSEVVAR